jgi:hypothetical protein
MVQPHSLIETSNSGPFQHDHGEVFLFRRLLRVFDLNREKYRLSRTMLPNSLDGTKERE